jgi:murein DD-endopeptidase MepM/ murein hydrolase activator NlpD
MGAMTPFRSAALLALSLLSISARADAPYTLRGDWEQGSVLVGKTAPGTRVQFEDRRLTVSPEGLFVIGLDRDEKAEVTLKLVPPKGTEIVEQHAVAKREWDVQPIEGLPQKYVEPPKETLARIKREQALIGETKRHDTPRSDFATPFVWPAQGRISGIFGSQRILNGMPKSPHYGTDVAVPVGMPVVAPAGGIVSLAESDLYFTGGTVIIDHGHGLQSILVHLSKLLVKKGDEVRQGQLVAESGMTGRATGPHLHWGLYWFDAHVDAQKFTGPMPAPVVAP